MTMNKMYLDAANKALEDEIFAIKLQGSGRNKIMTLSNLYKIRSALENIEV